MTMQIPDSYDINGEEYINLRQEGTGFFDPCGYGFKLKRKRLSCLVCGYIGRYVIADGRLFLEKLSIETEDDRYPDLNGVAYSPEKGYVGVHLPITCTGRILFSDALSNAYFLIDCLLQAKQLYEYDFVEGKVVRIVDHSRAALALQKIYQCRILCRLLGNDAQRIIRLLPGKLRRPLEWIWNIKPVQRIATEE